MDLTGRQASAKLAAEASTAILASTAEVFHVRNARNQVHHFIRLRLQVLIPDLSAAAAACGPIHISRYGK
jgi:hypothetical protein